MKILLMEEERYCYFAALSICRHMGDLSKDKQKWLAREIQSIINDTKDALKKENNKL